MDPENTSVNLRIRGAHVAGIIPIAGQPLDFNFPWHECLNPIGEDYLAIEKAVLECAYAGCNTIWMVCPQPMQSLIKYRVGEYIKDPYFLRRSFFSPTKLRPYIFREVPIFYIPANPKDKNKRDSLVWSILYGANAAKRASMRLSGWLKPKKYFISFPYGVYAPSVIFKSRTAIVNSNQFFVSHEGKTIRDGEYLSCALNDKDMSFLKNTFRSKATSFSTKKDVSTDQNYILPLEERYSGRFLTIKDIFETLELEDPSIINVPWYYDISSWEKLRKYLGSNKRLKKPVKMLQPGSYWNGIGGDKNVITQDEIQSE